MNKENAKKLLAVARDWSQRLEDVGHKLIELRDNPGEFSTQEMREIVEEAERVFAAFNAVKYTVNIQDAPKTIQ